MSSWLIKTKCGQSALFFTGLPEVVETSLKQNQVDLQPVRIIDAKMLLSVCFSRTVTEQVWLVYGAFFLLSSVRLSLAPH